MSAHTISKEKIDYVIAHINDRPRTKVMKDAGVSNTMMYRLVREYGGEMQYERCKRNPEWERIVKENYASMSGREIERKFGIPKGRVNKIVSRLGISHSEDVLRQIRKMQLENLCKSHEPEVKARSAKRWKTRRKMDEYRVMCGQEQLTKHKIRKMTKRAYAAKYCLCKKYGYLMDDSDQYVLYYDSNTKRVVGPTIDGHIRYYNEGYYSEKYHLIFKELM